MYKNIFNAAVFSCFLLISISAPAQQSTDIGTKIQQALASDIRTDEDRDADSYRKPVETLLFFGLRDDMRVLELIPGGGWYTKILGQVLADNGKLYLGANASAVGERLSEWGLGKVEVLNDRFEMKPGERRGHNSVVDVEFPAQDLDMVLTFRNMHNMSPEGRQKLNMAVFNALKSGGIYGVVDHTRRHMEPWEEVTWRRVDPVAIIKELQDIGFEFVDYSDIHYRPHDALDLDTTHPSINRDSDRFTLKFVKP